MGESVGKAGDDLGRLRCSVTAVLAHTGPYNSRIHHTRRLIERAHRLMGLVECNKVSHDSATRQH